MTIKSNKKIPISLSELHILTIKKGHFFVFLIILNIIFMIYGIYIKNYISSFFNFIGFISGFYGYFYTFKKIEVEVKRNILEQELEFERTIQEYNQ